MFSRHGPSFKELIEQALSSTEVGYDKLAPKFDLTPFRTPDAVVERCLSDLGTVTSTLDLCCGTGAVLALAKPITARRLVGVDFSSGMLAVARERAAAAPGTATIELVKQDVLTLDYEREFELVTCFGAFGHIEVGDEPRFVAMIRRALVPGGRFVFVTGYRPRSLSFAHVVLRTFNGVMRVRNALLSPPFIMYYLTFMLPETEGLLRLHGFEVEVERDLFEEPYRRLVRVIATRR